jgi:hypothetical protein
MLMSVHNIVNVAFFWVSNLQVQSANSSITRIEFV